MSRRYEVMKFTAHPSAIISPTARIGANCYIGPYCYIGPRVIIGNDNRLEAYVSIGTTAEHRDYFLAEPGEVIIGDGNIFREFVTINAGTKSPTVVESKCVLLRGSHVGHDALIRDFVNMSCNVLIGGHSIIGRGANLGLNSSVHQHRAVGAFSMIGMNSAVTRHTPPFMISFGTPARPQRINRIGLTRAGVTEMDLAGFEKWFQMFEETGSINPIAHDFNRFLAQYLNDSQNFAAGRSAA